MGILNIFHRRVLKRLPDRRKLSGQVPYPSTSLGIKVFWFFSSEKNILSFTLLRQSLKMRDKPKKSEHGSGTAGRDVRSAHMSTQKKSPEPMAASNTVKDPSEWTTGDETMTGAQASYLKTLCAEGGEAFDPAMTKAEASRMIDALQSKTGRGRDH
jgi:hypothetical protein